MEGDEVTYQCTKRKLVCSNTRFEVFFDSLQLSDSASVPDFLVVRPRVQSTEGVAGILVLPEVGGKIGLMRGWRHQYLCEIWQGPSGFMEPGESTQEAAIRELKEETGLTCKAENMISLGVICPDAGLLEGRVELFLARCAEEVDDSSVEQEIGTGALEYFSSADLKMLLDHSDDIGGATLAAGYRSLSLIASDPELLKGD